MLSRPRRVILVSIVALVFVCVFLCANAGNILDGLCKEDTAIADLDAGSNRHIIITGQSCWEVGRGLHYEVKDGGRIVSPKSLYSGLSLREFRMGQQLQKVCDAVPSST